MFLTSESNTISNSILWSCLDDDVDDAILLKHSGNPEPHENAEEDISSRASRILFLRRSVLRCLQNNIIQLENKNYSLRVMPHRESKCYHSGSLSLRGISRVFGMTISLSNLLNFANEVRRNAGPLILLLLATSLNLLVGMVEWTTSRQVFEHWVFPVIPLQTPLSCIFGCHQRYPFRIIHEAQCPFTR